MMTARTNADDIIPASAPGLRGALSDPVAASEFRAALSGLTTDVFIVATGSPYCKDALVAFDCELMEAREVGAHTVLIARVLATAHAEAPAEPLVYHRQHSATTRVL